jgi:uncharacterized protein (TIGR02466 family)
MKVPVEKTIMSIFSTPIAKIGLERDLSIIEKEFICNQSKLIHSANSVKQSENTNILDNIILSDLKDLFQKSLDIFFQEWLKPSTNVRLKITQSWANYSSIGQSHERHHHPNSIISGVFYVNTNQNCDKIFFCKPIQLAEYQIESAQFNIWNATEFWFPAEEGTLLLFPSTLEHMVPPVVGEKERISISFNSFFSGEIGLAKKYTQLIV